jgi:hypothetical protein
VGVYAAFEQAVFQKLLYDQLYGLVDFLGRAAPCVSKSQATQRKEQ